MQSMIPCLWFDTEGETAARFYTSLFPNSRITGVEHYRDGGDRDGTVMTVSFELNGTPFVALNGGPHFTPNEAVSFQVPCDDQAEIDRYWDALTANGGEESMCGWCKDRWGFSWQIFPNDLPQLLGSPDPEKAKRVAEAMYTMRRLDLDTLKNA
jgi:predicted 3-demethylubiquinone-9 3-methyltransferase (glyoxalase superfamily)